MKPDPDRHTREPRKPGAWTREHTQRLVGPLTPVLWGLISVAALFLMLAVLAFRLFV